MGKCGIYFGYVDARFSYNKKRLLQSFIAQLVEHEGRKVDRIQYIFCSDAYLLSINQQFLQHDYFTDIITFDFSNDSMSIVGEVYISIDRVRDNANLFKVSFFVELLRVVVHGALHLCGYDDKSDMDTIVMREKEAFYIGMFQMGN